MCDFLSLTCGKCVYVDFQNVQSLSYMLVHYVFALCIWETILPNIYDIFNRTFLTPAWHERNLRFQNSKIE
jgi:hypothetical protein